MAVWRNEVSLFDEREMAILTAFAGQAAMAINGVKLVQELEARRAELARKVDELEALRALGEAVGSSSTSSACSRRRWPCTPSASERMAARSWSTTSTTAPSSFEPRVSDGTHSHRPSCAASVSVDATLVGRAAKERTPLAAVPT